MPRVPKWMANAMESLFSGNYRPVVVTAVNYLDNTLKSVRFEGDLSTVKKEFVPGNVVEFRVNDTEFRHYTPSYFNRQEGVCEVVFYLHDMGPGSQWAAGLQKGDSVKLIGPGGKVNYKKDAPIHIVFGDETSLGLMHCIWMESMLQGRQCYCIAELDEAHHHWPGLMQLEADTVKKVPAFPAHHAIYAIERWLDSYNGDKDTLAFYLTGNAKAIQAFRNSLNLMGFNNKQIQTDPYWTEGKSGL